VTAPAIKGLNCPSCGGAIELRAGAVSQTVVCPSCRAVLDAQDPNLKILQQMDQRLRFEPAIPLGTRGKLKGDPYEVIGFQVRGIRVDEVDYYWREYVLWSPYKGFRYLTEYDGHWNDVAIAKSAPDEKVSGRQPIVEYLGQTFRHFQSATATTHFILGEFPWQVRVGDKANVRDFVAPPYMLSQEVTPDETTWSIGTYISPERIWEGFGLQGKPPRPRGVYANQPDTGAGTWKELARIFAIFAVVFLGFFVLRNVTAQRAQIFNGRYIFSPAAASQGGPDSSAFVTPIFEARGRKSNVEVRIDTDLSNNWAYFDIALINDQTGTAYDLGREVSYYYGRDSDGSYSEGSTTDVSYVPSVPSGRYYLRVQPSGDATYAGLVGYSLRVRRDVPRFSLFLVAFLLLAIPPVLAGLRAWSFETTRWKESDYAPSGGDDDE
jgi:hypothetical protein